MTQTSVCLSVTLSEVVSYGSDDLPSDRRHGYQSPILPRGYNDEKGAAVPVVPSPQVPPIPSSQLPSPKTSQAPFSPPPLSLFSPHTPYTISASNSLLSFQNMPGSSHFMHLSAISLSQLIMSVMLAQSVWTASWLVFSLSACPLWSVCHTAAWMSLLKPSRIMPFLLGFLFTNSPPPRPVPLTSHPSFPRSFSPFTLVSGVMPLSEDLHITPPVVAVSLFYIVISCFVFPPRVVCSLNYKFHQDVHFGLLLFLQYPRTMPGISKDLINYLLNE